MCQALQVSSAASIQALDLPSVKYKVFQNWSLNLKLICIFINISWSFLLVLLSPAEKSTLICLSPDTYWYLTACS